MPIQTLIGMASAKVYKEREVWEFFNGVFVGPPIEEIAKGLFPLFACLSLGIKGRRALLVLGAMSGIGFFFTESFCASIAAILHGTVNDWTHELSGRVFSLGHQHAMYTGFVGLGIAFAASRKNWFERIGFVLLGLAIGVGFHSTFNALAQAIDAGEGKEGWAYTWSLNRRLISIYVALLVVAVYRRERAHWTEVFGKKRASEACPDS
jgi:RsiW-degrading membrane proteinase PrsW (M82 family)